MKKLTLLNGKVLKTAGFVFLLLTGLYFYATAAQESKEKVIFVYDDHGKRDPLWALVTAGGAIMNYETEFLITDLALEGVVVDSGDGDLAIINGRVVKANDSIGQFIVLQIEPDKVILLKDQQKFELRLK